jgi:superfamily I DNA/RNA helicase
MLFQRLDFYYFSFSFLNARSTPSSESESTNLELVNNIIKQFEATNPIKKYKSDWKTFLIESKIEDFVNIEAGTIYVSTIHKAKGKEFENVFIMLRNFKPYTDENKRPWICIIWHSFDMVRCPGKQSE